jgi:hypothetical protein
MEKKLWCVSIKREDDESETIFHVKAENLAKAKEIATDDWVESSGFYQGSFALFNKDLDNGGVIIYGFEIMETDILE